MKMKNLFCLFLVQAALCAGAAQEALRNGFADPPADSRLQAWFHWVSDDVTKAGLAADLKAMGEMEIGTAHIFLAGMANLPPGPKALTPEWCDLLSFAAQEAKKNNIHLGIHNCPGWSSSGGPWIKPENSMKMVVASETDVDGAAANIKLPQPAANNNFYRDIAVLAFPIQKQSALRKATPSFSADTEAFRLGRKPMFIPVDHKGDVCSLTLEYATPFAAKFAVFRFTDDHLFLNGEIQASPDGVNFVPAGKFAYAIFRVQKTPKIVQLENAPANSRFFKIIFRHQPPLVFMSSAPVHLAKVDFTDLPMIRSLDQKNSASTQMGYQPPANGTEENKGIPATSVQDLTHKMKPDGTLEWNPQNSSWRVLRIGYTSTGKCNSPATVSGLECDKLSKSGLDAHWPNFMAKVLAVPGVRDVLRVSIIDSYEVGGQNWTESLPAFFNERRGYDMMKYLPALVGYAIDTEADTAKFLYDFQRTVADMFAENYYGYFSKLCHDNGLQCALEPYGGPFDEIQCGKYADIPTGEFWLGGSTKGSPRTAASIAHLYGRAKVGAESFTTEAEPGRWQATPKQLKRYGDQGWLEGISQLVYHSYVHQPWVNVQPGVSLGRHGSQLNRNTTWWKEGVAWSRYVNRGQFLLQRGKPMADVLLVLGDSQPTAYPEKLIADGYNFDYANEEVLQTLHNEGEGVAVPNGLPYPLLALGKEAYRSVATLKKIKALLEDGCRVAGVRPAGSPCLKDNPAEFAALADAIWGRGAAGTEIRKVGRGSLVPCADAVAALTALQLPPPVQTRGALRSLAREMDGCTVYFVSNPQDKPFFGNVLFRAPTGSRPEFWDAVTGEMNPCPVCQRKDGGTEIEMRLAGYGSVFVVFPPAAGKAEATVAEAQTEYARAQILSAFYHDREDATRGREVTEILRKTVASGAHAITVSNQTLGGDPLPNHPKRLTVLYKLNGLTLTNELPEFSTLALETALPPIAEFETKGDKTLLLFRKPGETAYRLQGKSAEVTVRVAASEFPAAVSLDAGWTVAFTGKNAPKGPIAFPTLKSWSENDNPQVKYFAGTGRYTKTFTMEPREFAPNVRWILDLGDVRELCRVTLNGKDLGCLWNPPFELNVTDFLKTGGNSLRVDVINTWPNRMIGDAITRKTVTEPMQGAWPKWVMEDRPDSGTGIYTWSHFKGWSEKDALLPAGLLGPAALRPEVVREISGE